MRNFGKIILLLLIILVAAFVGYNVLIFLLGGPALDNFFELTNRDSGTHEISVEIFDSDNESVFKESYKLYPNESVSKAKPFNLRSSFESKEYTFRIILDNGFAEETTSVSLNRWSTATIDIYWDHETPIIIGITAV